MVVIRTSALRKELVGVAAAASEAALKGSQTQITPYRGTELRQARQYYDPIKITLLAESIDRTELINAVEIAQLDETQARYYIRVWNRVWNTRYKLSDISRGPDGRYEIVVDGHCRRRGGIRLCEEGRPPKNWRAHFLPNITPEEALERQFQENIHSKPETWEDADSVYRFWVFLIEVEREHQRIAKRLGTEHRAQLTLREFAERVGRSEGTVRDYLRFGEAPRILQTAVRKEKIAYGMGILLARAVKSGAISMHQLKEHWLPLAELPGQSIRVFEKAMETRIEAARHKQDDLFGDLSVEEVAKAYESDRKAVVYPQLVNRIHENIHYLAGVRELAEAGRLGVDGPYSDASPNRIYQAMVDELERSLPHMRRLSAQQHQHNLQVLSEAAALMSELGEEPAPELSLPTEGVAIR